MRKKILAFLVCSMAPSVSADGLAQLRHFLQHTKSLSAQFQQTTYQKKKNQQSQGRFLLERPGRFRWQYEQPYPQSIISDGKTVWIYDPDLMQVTEQSLEQTVGDTPAALLAGSNQLEKGFTWHNASSDSGLEWVRATPKSSGANFLEIALGFSGQQLQQMSLKDQFGQTTTIIFSDIQANLQLDPSHFKFTPPPNVDVIQGRDFK